MFLCIFEVFETSIIHFNVNTSELLRHKQPLNSIRSSKKMFCTISSRQYFVRFKIRKSVMFLTLGN